MTEERVHVLCQCGWGRLAIPESEVPDFCPICGFDFSTLWKDEEDDYAIQ